jgi:hypothetical protein
VIRIKVREMSENFRPLARQIRGKIYYAGESVRRHNGVK